MATPTAIAVPVHPHRTGLDYWMVRVLKECDRTQRDFDPEAVHDLRVALRRCRSLANGLMEVDCDPAWRRMKKLSRKLFRCLGKLRDTQVLIEWAQKLAPEDDPVRQRLVEILREREQQGKMEAQRALKRFNRKGWQRFTRRLPARARRVPLNGLVFQHLALERWNEAYELHRRALRRRSCMAYHRLRIGLKRFRYTVESFLPQRQGEWGPDLKRLQDLLGDVHDLDVLRQTLRITGAVFDGKAQARWHGWIEGSRKVRLDEYRQKMAGKESLWATWRAGLPLGKRLEEAAVAKLGCWASFLDPDFAHAQRVAGLALELFDGFRAVGLHPLFRDVRARRILHGAALLHDVGRSVSEAGHHKASYRMIRDLPAPLGWTTEEMGRAALLSRYHRGAAPRPNHEGFGALSPDEQQNLHWLAGVLRLADSFDSKHDGRITHVRVESTREAVVVCTQGYSEDSALAARVAEKKHLLESVCARPLVVRAEKGMLETPIRRSAAS